MYKKIKKICKYCWEEFDADYPTKEYCNRECRKLWTKLEERECPVCLKMFHPNNSNAKYCSRECSKIWNTIREETICPICNKTFMPHNANTKFCSRECANIAQTAKDIECPICWKMFHPRTWQKYCSNECNSKSKIKLEDRKCEYCWNIFHPKLYTQTYCSKQCAYKYRTTLTERKCERCWETFKPSYNMQRFCSNKCAKRNTLIEDKICPICWKEFRPYHNGMIYCSIECRWRWRSEHIKSLPKEEQEKRNINLHSSQSKAVSSENIKYIKKLEDKWYSVSWTEVSIYYWSYFWDIMVWNAIIEISPRTYHNSTFNPKWAPRIKYYHQNKAKSIISSWYDLITIRDWDSDDTLFDLLEYQCPEWDVIKLWLDKCIMSVLKNKWYILEWISEPIAHRYNQKTKDHIVDMNEAMTWMEELGYVKIYDCWIATFIHKDKIKKCDTQ